MKVKNPLASFFNVLLPTFSRSRVEDDSRAVRKELQDHTMPMLQIPASVGGDFFLVEKLDKELGKIGLRGNIWAELRDLLEKRLDEWEKLNDVIEESFQREINTSGMDYYRLQILFVISLYRFWGEYVRKLILVAAAKNRGNTKGVNREYEEFVVNSENHQAFLQVTELMKMSFRDIQIAAKKGKDITVSDGPGSESAQRRADGIDSNFIPISLNPVLAVNRLVNTLVSYYYDLAKQQKESLEMEILYMKRQQSGASPEELEDTERVIKAIQSRIAILESKMEDLREE